MDTTQNVHSPLGVCALPDPSKNLPRTMSYASYVHEILSHAGLCYSALSLEDLPDCLPGLRVLVTLGEAGLDESLSSAIRAWVEAGGVWISVAGTCGMADLFGVEVESASFSIWNSGVGNLGEGYLSPSDDTHPALSHLRIPLHFFNGLPARVMDATELAVALDAHQRSTGRTALCQSERGNGMCMLIAPDLTGAVVRIQQGVGITRDGVPAPDGCGCRSDDILKSDDGAVLDWIFDREPVSGVPGLSCFLQPVADQWRELLLRAIFHACERVNLALPVLWLYPRNLPALATMSCDTDGNNEEKALQMLAIMFEAGVRGTWCVIPPGYSSRVTKDARVDGHELAMHYDAISDGHDWSENDLAKTYAQVVTALAGERPVTNKNHFLRWEGDTEFFEWLARAGIRLDQSKGPSKTGEAGFIFGACHPYFPISPDGRLIDVLELPTHTQDLVVFAPTEIAGPLIDAALRHHGIVHFLFHPEHVDKPGQPEAIRHVVRLAKEAGMEWWTAREIDLWERARREVSWTYNEGSFSLIPKHRMQDATVLFLGQKPGRRLMNGRELQTQDTERWGFRFTVATVTLESDHIYSFHGGVT